MLFLLVVDCVYYIVQFINSIDMYLAILKIITIFRTTDFAHLHGDHNGSGTMW